MAEKWAALLIKTGSNKERQNIIWNMIGSFCYAFASMVLSFLVMRFIGEEEGGIFSFGYSTLGQQLFILAYFGIRPFQVTDGTREYRFGDYLHHRYITCVAALAGGLCYLAISGYSLRKALVLFLLICYKVTDGFADVYESEFQRNGKLYLTGKSNAFRTLLSVGTFLTTLSVYSDLTAACVAAAAAQISGVVLFDIIILHRLMGVDYDWNLKRMWSLTKGTLLLFLSVFLDFYVFSSVKYAIDAHLGDAASGYFNVIFMPTSMINLAAGFVIRPILTYLTQYWNERSLQTFHKALGKLSAVISGLGAIAVVSAVVLGKPVLRVMEQILGIAYIGSLTKYYGSFVLIVLGGVFYAVLNLYYYVLVIMRRQKWIFEIYLVMTVIASALAPGMVKSGGIPGAAMAYLVLMVLMAAGFVGCAWLGYWRENSNSGRCAV